MCGGGGSVMVHVCVVEGECDGVCVWWRGSVMVHVCDKGRRV